MSSDTVHWQTNEYGERWIQEVNQNAFQAIPSARVFEKAFQDRFIDEDHLYIVIGTDSGLLPKYIADHFCNKKRKFVFIEKKAYLNQLTKNPQLLSRAPCITLLSETEFNFEKLLEAHPYYLINRKFSLVKSLGVLDQTSPTHIKLWENIQEELNLFQIKLSDITNKKSFIDNLIYNAPLNTMPATHLKGLLEGKTVILLGGGTTLDTGIPWLKTHQDQIIIAAIGRIAKRLIHEGIQVDLYHTIDPSTFSYDNSKWLTQASNALLTHQAYANPTLLAEFIGGPRYFTDDRLPWKTPLNPANLHTHGPTVVNNLLHILIEMGAKNVYLLGVDFCYGPQGETHEGGSLEAQQGSLIYAGELKLETYSGRIALTNKEFYDAYMELQHYLDTYPLGNTQIFQLGQESAKLSNIPLKSFQEIPLTAHKTPLIQLATSMLKQAQALEQKQERYFLNTLLDELHSKRKSLQALNQLTAEGVKLAKTLFDQPNKVNKKIDRIIKLKHKITHAKYKWAHHLAEMYNIKNFIHIFSEHHHPTEAVTEKQLQTNFIHHFEALQKTTHELIQTLDKAIAHTQNRQREFNPDYFMQCAEYWQQHGQEGRVRLWLKMHNKQLEDLPEPVRQRARTLLKAYEQKLSRQAHDTLLGKLLQVNAKTFLHQLEALTSAFETQDTEKLQLLISALTTENSPRGQSIKALAQGYLLELQQDIAQAMQHYLMVTEQDLIPLALNRVTQLALDYQDFETAMKALEILVAFDDRYLLTYAELLLQLKDPAGAIQVYDHYLQKHPQDATVWLAAAKAAIEGGDHSAANQCLNEVLNNSSDDLLKSEAQKLLNSLSSAHKAT